MIKLSFLAQRKVIHFHIKDKVITYYDDNWPDGIQIVPSQTPEMKLMLKKMLVDRRPAIRGAATFIVDANSGKNKEEYEKCNTDSEVAELIRRDCKEKGLLEVK